MPYNPMTRDRNDQPIRVGDRIVKDTGDYHFVGEVRAIFPKRSGVVRLVAENASGLLFIFTPKQVRVALGDAAGAAGAGQGDQ